MEENTSLAHAEELTGKKKSGLGDVICNYEEAICHA